MIQIATMYSNTDLDALDEREDLLEVFMDLDHQLAASKWNLAKLWLFGSGEELTAEQQLEVAGLVY